MKIRKYELGVGLIEVLVALILLAIGVLGYTALQLRAVDASNEALIRSQATVLLRGLTESMRVNPKGQVNYSQAVQNYSSITSSTSAPAKSCLKETCTPSQMAIYDAYQTARSALNFGIHITMTNCPGVQGKIMRQCLFAAWDSTGNTMTATDYSSCMDNSGIYAPNATCLMMEAY